MDNEVRQYHCTLFLRMIIVSAVLHNIYKDNRKRRRFIRDQLKKYGLQDEHPTDNIDSETDLQDTAVRELAAESLCRI
jgi:hypothetical protein